MRTVPFLALGLMLIVMGITEASAQSMEQSSGLRGTIIAQPVPASDFSLTDQTGATFHMSSTRGKVVVLSFIYTHCAAVCPYVTVKLKEALSQLGPDARNVIFVAVTTDPKRDTPSIIARYSREVGLFNSWHFLTGSPAEVEKVWSLYGVGVHIVTAADLSQSGGGSMSMMSGQHDEGLNARDKTLVMKIIREFAGGYMVTHSAPFWIVDASGDVRAILNADAMPEDIVTDARILMHG
ncbi:MAG: SCO family protein [Rectinemataceae bacterium]